MDVFGLLPVHQLLHLVDAYEPVLRRVGLLQMSEVKVLVTNLNVTCAIKARRRAEVKLSEEKSVIRNSCPGSRTDKILH